MLHDQSCGQPGVVVAHHVAVGDDVSAGDPLLVVESMKCEHHVLAETGGRVDWLVPVGEVIRPEERVVRLVQRAAPRPPAPMEVVEMYLGCTPEPRLHRAKGTSRFVELDVAPGEAGVVVGRMSHQLGAHAEPVERVWLCSDATTSLGAVAEPECRRILAAIDLAEAERLPLEWVTISSGAKISMSSGTENMDWCAAVVRRLVEFTQGGGEVVVLVAGINVGAQSYWNAEATMLMHCAGMLVMVEGSSMVLTGSRSLGRAGALTEASDHDLGGVGVMSANGEAHHVVGDLADAIALVLDHHALCAAGPRHPPAQHPTFDHLERDIAAAPYDGPSHHGWARVGDLLDAATHPSRTRPFAIEPVMAALVDSDAPRLCRWPEVTGGSGTVVWDTRIDGWPVTVVGVESQSRGEGSDWEAAGTLYPAGARKVARALNHASGRRPAVVLANLAGFDGSRSSLLGGQLEAGAELARAVVNFRGPLVVVVVGRFHGGAYVVLNRRLNPELTILAVEGARVSVIGGSSAAEVVLRREVREAMESEGVERSEAVRLVADRFDRIHDVVRAKQVGSVDRVVTPAELRAAVAELVAAGSAPSPADGGPLSLRRRGPQPAGTSAVLA